MSRKIVFFGDSITAGSKSLFKPLGEGYVAMIAKLFRANPALKNLKVINSGINGHTVQDLLDRYPRDVVSHQPQYLTIMIGINDAYHEFVGDGNDSLLKNYELAYRKLIILVKAASPDTQIFLFTPYYISDKGDESLYTIMANYIQIVKNLGAEFKLPVLDVQALFHRAVKQKPALEWAADQIHPVQDGHELIAKHVFEFLKQEI